MLNSCAKTWNVCTNMIRNVKFVCKKRKSHQNSTKIESTKNPNFSKIPEKSEFLQISRKIRISPNFTDIGDIWYDDTVIRSIFWYVHITAADTISAELSSIRDRNRMDCRTAYHCLNPDHYSNDFYKNRMDCAHCKQMQITTK